MEVKKVIMKGKRILFLLNIILILSFSCKNTNEENSINNNQHHSSKAQITIDELIQDVKMLVPLDTILKRYYYNFEEILNSPYFNEVIGGAHNLLHEMLNSNDSLYFFWNDEIDSVSPLSWLNKSSTCTENLLILEGEDALRGRYLCFCFTKNGEIYSNFVLTDKKTGLPVWLRNEEKYVIRKGDTTIIRIQ